MSQDSELAPGKPEGGSVLIRVPIIESEIVLKETDIQCQVNRVNLPEFWTKICDPRDSPSSSNQELLSNVLRTKC